jgi:4-hydroxybenzoate polyprenyltransferase
MIWALLDHVAFLRPLLLAPAATTFLLGRAAAQAWSRGAGGGAAPVASGARDAALAALALGAVLVATHVANQLADRESDRANGKLPYLSGGLVSVRAARVLLGASLAAWVGLVVALPASLAALEGVALALGAAYAMPPLALKARAGWDLAANAIGYGGVAYAIGWESASRAGAPALAPPELAALAAGAAPWALAVGGVFAATTVVDEPGDRAAGSRTLAVRLGPGAARRIAALLMLAAAAAAAVTGARAALLLAGLALLPLMAPLVRPSRAADHVAFQASALLPTGYVAIRWPLFGAALAATFVVVRVYHARRFGLAYPALGAPRYEARGGRRTMSDALRASSRNARPSSSGW